VAFSDNAIAFLERKEAATFAELQRLRGQAENDLRTGATWKDQTGAARLRLFAKVTRLNERTFLFTLSHGVQYGRYFEKGTGIYGPNKRPIVIKATTKRGLYWGAERGGKPLIVKKVINPGMKARPIVGPTAEKYKKEIRDSLLDLWGAR